MGLGLGAATSGAATGRVVTGRVVTGGECVRLERLQHEGRALCASIDCCTLARVRVGAS